MENFGEAVILCGGKSSRMGFDKSLAKIDNDYIIEALYKKLSTAFETVKLCANSREKFSAFNMQVIEDLQKDKGPAVAIYSVLLQATTKYVFVVACDMPMINMEHVTFMKSLLEEKISAADPPDALIPMKGGYIEPLYGFYSINSAETFGREIENSNQKIASILQKCNTLYMQEAKSRVFDKDLGMFTNLNRIEDLEGIVWSIQ